MRKLKVGDWVKIISGKYKNKIVKIKLVRIKDRKITFDNSNLQKKNLKTKLDFKINISNVIYFSPAYNLTSKIHFFKINSKKYRCLKKNSFIIPN
jgi:ribosomal protein L24